MYKLNSTIENLFFFAFFDNLYGSIFLKLFQIYILQNKIQKFKTNFKNNLN